MKKKIVCVLLISMMVVTMMSCSKDNNKDNNSSTDSSTDSSIDNENSSSTDESSTDESSTDESSTESSDGDSDAQTIAEGLAEKLIKDIDFKDEMSAIDTGMALMQYNLTDNEVEEVVMYLSTGATAEEVAVFKVKDDNIRQVQSAVEKRVYDKKASFKDYNPAELKKLEDPTMYVKDGYVVLCISDEDSKSRKVIDKYLSEK